MGWHKDMTFRRLWNILILIIAGFNLTETFIFIGFQLPSAIITVSTKCTIYINI